MAGEPASGRTRPTGLCWVIATAVCLLAGTTDVVADGDGATFEIASPFADPPDHAPGSRKRQAAVPAAPAVCRWLLGGYATGAWGGLPTILAECRIVIGGGLLIAASAVLAGALRRSDTALTLRSDRPGAAPSATTPWS